MKRLIKERFGKTKLYVAIRSQLIKFRVWTYRNLSDREFIRRDFKYIYGYDFDFNNPVGYHEVLSWYKTTDLLRSYHPYADKFEVRKYIADKLGEEYLVPLHAVWESIDEVDLDSLPDRYVIIPSHLSGMKFIQDGTKNYTKAMLMKEIKRWFGLNYHDLTREPQYKDMKPRVLVYKYLQDETGDLSDYKYFMIDNKIYMIFMMMFRRTGMQTMKYDQDWHPMEYLNSLKKKITIIDKPAFADEMEEAAFKLCEGFPFVRVDFYYVDGQLYVGELTFTHGDSRLKFDVEEFNNEVGELIYTAVRKCIEETG